MSQRSFDVPTSGNLAPSHKTGGPTSLPLSPSTRQRRRNLFLDLPIGWRLTLGFVVAALVAAAAAGIVGVQRSNSLSEQTDFYHTLLQVNTSLTNGRSFLDLMNLEVQQTMSDASATNPSRETLADDASAVVNLAGLYDQTLRTYTQRSLLTQHPDEVSLLNEAGASILIAQQVTLTSSAERTWNVYQTAQQQILDYIANSDLPAAQQTWQQQGEPTNEDALSALQSLIQLNNSLASAVDSATNVEVHNELITTLIATVCAFLAIALVGWFISETLVRRLRELHRVTRSVEEGRISERAMVIGRDEIADVADAVNTMLNTIFGLLEETRQQRDALAGAAEHLFSDMRIVNAGDLRVSATVSNDPIGMLANAFNFTVGRFRRFILRTQTTVEQLDVVSRQELERSNAFISLVRNQMREPKPSFSFSNPPRSQPLVADTRPNARRAASADQGTGTEDSLSLLRQVQQTREGLVQTTRDDLYKHLHTAREIIERATTTMKRLNELVATRGGSQVGGLTERMTQAQLQELLSLEKHLRAISWELQQTEMTSSASFTRIDTALTHLARQLAEPPAPSSSATNEQIATLNEQHQEFVRQAGSFGLEVNTLAKRLGTIIQEMRTGITPFRLDSAVASMNDLTKSLSAQSEHDQPEQKVPNWNAW
jgi:methyl-accepting chemotaxis protein